MTHYTADTHDVTCEHCGITKNLTFGQSIKNYHDCKQIQLDAIKAQLDEIEAKIGRQINDHVYAYHASEA